MAGAQKIESQQQPPLMGAQKKSNGNSNPNNKSVQSNLHSNATSHANNHVIVQQQQQQHPIKTAALLRYNHSINNTHQYLLRNKKNRSCYNYSDNHFVASLANNNNNDEDAVNYNTTDQEIHLSSCLGRRDNNATVACDPAVQITRHSWHQTNGAGESVSVAPPPPHHQSRASGQPKGSCSSVAGDERRATAVVVTHQAPPPYSVAYVEPSSRSRRRSSSSQHIDHQQQEQVVALVQSGEGARTTTTVKKRSEKWREKNRDVEKGIVRQSPVTDEGQRRTEESGGGRRGVSEVVPAEDNEGDPEEAEEEEEEDGEDAELEGEGRHRRRRKPKPLYRSLLNYIRSAWSGVNSSGNDSELEELEATPRYRPESVSSLCRVTRFSEEEIKRLYRGFKAECPTGMVREETFKAIYSQFFPNGANSGMYAHYVFNTLDQSRSGLVSFEDFVLGLSILSRGTVEEKLRWTFALYDINGDGFITREEMTEIVTAIYELAGSSATTASVSSAGAGPSSAAATILSSSTGTSTHHSSSHYPHLHLPHLLHGHHHNQQQQQRSHADENVIRAKVERIFQKMDLNCDGVVTIEEFLESCCSDEAICRSLAAFDSSF